MITHFTEKSMIIFSEALQDASEVQARFFLPWEILNSKKCQSQEKQGLKDKKPDLFGFRMFFCGIKKLVLFFG